MAGDRKLSVWLRGWLVGTLTQDASGRLSFRYASKWLDGVHPRPLSISLPLGNSPFTDRETRPFFAGLLPDDEVRRRLARYLGVSDRNDFALLEIVGGECAGAVALYPEGEEPERPEEGFVEDLSGDRLSEIIRSLPQRPLLVGGELRLSLAGAQDKIAVCVAGDVLGLPRRGRPTTHILKTPIERFEDTVHNEIFCMRLAARMGLSVPKTEMRRSAAGPFLLVERFDRETGEAGATSRIHQEDFCQALGIPPELRYQSEGGPSLSLCFALLEQHGSRPAQDRLRLLDAVIYNFLIGNADAHGKNFSLLHEAGGVRLAPLYDLVSTLVYPGLSPKMAMKVGGDYRFGEILPRHWQKFAREVGLSPGLVLRRLEKLALSIGQVAVSEREQLRGENIVSKVIDSIRDSIEERVRAVTRRVDQAGS